MSILFLHGLESGPCGRKSRYLQEQYSAQIRVPDLRISLWRLDKANCVFRNALRLAYQCPSLVLSPWNALVKEAVLASLEGCAAIAVEEIRNSDEHLQLVIGSSWGGAVALRLLARGDWNGSTLLLAPALKRILVMDGENDAISHRLLESWYGAIKAHRVGVEERSKIVVVHGDSDDTVPLEDSQELCAAIGARLMVVPRGDHSLNEYLLNRNKFQELVDSFIDA